MQISEVSFAPHSDMDTNDLSLAEAHKNLIESGNYSDATALLNDNSYKKGMRASLFNLIQSKMRNLELFLLNEFNPEKDTYYSDTEPTQEFMDKNGYTFWCKPY